MTPPNPPTGEETLPLAVLGECVADAFVSSGEADALNLEVLPGGGPANTAVALARLGTPTRFLGRLSRDVFGRLFHDHLAKSGVDLDGTVTASQTSTLAVASLSPQGAADYSFYADGAADWQWTAQELAEATRPRVAALHTGSLALVRPPGGALVEQALLRIRERATVSLDPNVRPLLVDPSVYRERLHRWCELTDILRLSDDDLAHLWPGGASETQLHAAADHFHRLGAPLVVITLGGDGVLASLRGSRLRVEAPRTEVVDTVGAGDSFMAGLLDALHRSGELGGRLDGLEEATLREALAHGTRVAALTVSVRGANPPWRHQL
ncbi:carbohydrate kinase [Streptomyces sp. NPDC005438]|uniref:carbohydrate kinase family protein n=1 Tax=Streptomyces sp. NPDC005438 TaxID=3156880 RepID=UPI0033AE2CAE